MKSIVVCVLIAISLSFLAHNETEAQSTVYYRTMSWSADSNYIAMARQDGHIEIWGSSGQFVRSWQADVTGATVDLAWYPDTASHLLASGGSDMVLQIWDADTGNLVDTFPNQNGIITSVFWSSDGTNVGGTNFNGYPFNIAMWDFQSHTLLTQASVSDIVHGSINSNDSLIAVAAGTVVEVYDASTGQYQYLLDASEGSGAISYVDWSPSGDLLVAASAGSPIDIWDITSKTIVHTLHGHADSVLSVKWSPNGDFVASTSIDGTIRVWGVTTENEVDTIQVTSILPQISWSPDSNFLAYNSDNQTVNVIPAPGATTCDHDIPTSDTATLISTITIANGNGNPTTICLAQDSTYTFTTPNNYLNAMPYITGDITIEGNNATITRSGTEAFRFFEVETGGKLTLNDLTLSNGDVSNARGGQLILKNVTFVDNPDD
jgi:WD40 repeat protein